MKEVTRFTDLEHDVRELDSAVLHQGTLLRDLQREVQRYLEKPGCNISSKQTAMARLKWALEESGK